MADVAETMPQFSADELSKAMDGVDAALDDIAGKVTCRYCNLFVDPMESVQKGANSFTCKECKRVDMILYRNLGERPSELTTMSLRDQREFWQRSHSMDDADGQGKWKLIRAALVEVRAEEVQRREIKSVGGAYLPLAVHMAQGWTKEQVESYQDYEEHPAPIGRLWRVPVKSVSVEDIKSSIEKELLTRERTFKKKRQAVDKSKASGSKKSPAQDAEPVTSSQKSAEVCVIIPTDSEEEPVKITKTAGAKSAKQEAREKAAMEKKQARENEKAMKSAHTLASKSLGPLSSLVNNLKAATAAIEKKGKDKFHDELADAVAEALEKMEKWQAECTSVVHKVQNKQNFDGHEVLSFNKAHFMTETKAAQALMADFRVQVRNVNEQNAAAKLRPKACAKKRAQK